jgi:hypothetical protein
MVLLCMNFLVLFEILGALKGLFAYLARNEHEVNGEKKGKNISNLTDMGLEWSVD